MIFKFSRMNANLAASRLILNLEQEISVLQSYFYGSLLVSRQLGSSLELVLTMFQSKRHERQQELIIFVPSLSQEALYF